MVRLLVTADWQIGMQATHVPEVAAKVRGARLDAARNVVRLANELAVDALVLAGDTFEDNQVSQAVAQKVLEILKGSLAPVYVLPGQHDPWGPDSVFKKAWKSLPGHVHVLSSPTPAPLPTGEATLYPCPVLSSGLRQDPTEVIPPRHPEDKIRIGVAHGSLALPGRHNPEDPVIAKDAGHRKGLDLLVVGHWHSLFFFPSRESITVLYPGTPEPTTFDEQGVGQACLVKIDRPGGAIEVREMPTRVLHWQTCQASVYDMPDLDKLRRDLAAIPEPGRTLVSLELTGAAPLPVLEELRRFLDTGLQASGFLHVKTDNRVLQAPTDAALEGLVRTPVLGRVVERLQAEIQAGGQTAVVARQALLILWSIEGGR